MTIFDTTHAKRNILTSKLTLTLSSYYDVSINSNVHFCVRPGSQYNASAAFCFISSPPVTDGGIELWSIPPSLTVTDGG